MTTSFPLRTIRIPSILKPATTRGPLKRHRLIVAIVALAAISSPLPAKQPPNTEKPLEVTVTLDRPDALYEIGETATFTITAGYKDGSPLDGTMQVHAGKVYPMKNEPVTIEHTMKKPGFVRRTAIGRRWKGEVCYLKSIAVAACEPEKIKPVVTMPDDFDAFWAKGRERLAEIPLDPRQERIDPLCTDDYEVSKVSFANINDTRIYGYLLVPTSGQTEYPGFVAVAPAGRGKPREDFVAQRLNNISRNGAICLYMGVYAHDLGRSKKYYNHFKSEWSTANADPEKNFFYRAILGIDRAITWLASREDVDNRRIVYTGNSQGGGYGLVMAGLNKNITAANVNIPGLCDHLAFREGRTPGWPGVLRRHRRGKMDPEQIDAIAEALPYFDAVNFARKIDVSILMSMGYLDTTCPPSGVRAAYNVIDAPKQILPVPDTGHGMGGMPRDVTMRIHHWLRSKLGLAEEE